LREYETVFVLHPNLEEGRVEEEIEGIKQTITAASGEILDVERWGRRRLAYSINKVHEGIYTLIRFRSGSSVVSSLERRYRLREDVLRYLTVLSHGRPPESMQRREEDGDHEEIATPGVEPTGEAPIPSIAEPPATVAVAAESAPERVEAHGPAIVEEQAGPSQA
jgi:small subunit ribosomal protein S6